MKKSDLKTGMRLKYRNGKIGIVMRDTYLEEDNIIYSTKGWDNFSVLNNDLSYHSNDRRLDVVEVYNGSIGCAAMLDFNASLGDLLWKREENIPEYTMEELQKKLGEEFKIKK